MVETGQEEFSQMIVSPLMTISLTRKLSIAQPALDLHHRVCLVLLHHGHTGLHQVGDIHLWPAECINNLPSTELQSVSV